MLLTAILPLTVAGLLSAGCGRGAAAEQAEVQVVPVADAHETAAPTAEAVRLEGGAASLDELLRTVERGLAERDTARLFDLMVSEREYREIVYPELPAAHPPIGASFESIWVTHFPDAYQGMLRVLGGFGGREVRILDVRFDAPDQDYGSFTLHETSRVDIEVDGRREDDRRLFGSVIHAGGRWKVLSYPDED